VVTTGTSPNQVTTVTYETLQTLVGSAQGLAYANGTLIVADANRQGGTPDNNRVLIYNDIQSWLPGPHDDIRRTGRLARIALGRVLRLRRRPAGRRGPAHP